MEVVEQEAVSRVAARPAAKRFARALPILGWARAYRREYVRGDLVAGATIAAILIPQGMAYAALAGMPPITGLYAAVVAIVVYAMLGTSPQLAVGPAAITSLLTASALAAFAGADAAVYVGLAGLLALLVGLGLVAAWALRLGVLANFLSHAVVSGFTAAAAIIIATSQLSHLLGISHAPAHTFVQALQALASGAATANLPTLAVGLSSLGILLLGKRLAPWLPWALVVLVAATLGSANLGLSDHGVAILRDVPAGLPAPSLPTLDLGLAATLVPAAAVIVVVGYMESISVAKAVAMKTRRAIDANREMLAVGAANGAAGAFGGFPVTGSFSRTAVNLQAGARTQLAALVAAALVAVVIQFFTPLFYYLPNAVLAAVVVAAVIGLIDLPYVRQTFRTRRADGLAILVTFATSLIAGVEIGIAAGVLFSLLAFVHRSANPHIVELGRVEGTTTFRDTSRYPVHTAPELAILRLDAPLYFANARFLSDRVTDLAARRPELRYVLLDASAIAYIDADGANTLVEMERQLREAGVELHVATLRGPVRDVLGRAGLWERLLDNATVHADIREALSRLELPSDSPLKQNAPTERRPEQVF